MTTALANIPSGDELESLSKLGSMFVASKFFKDATDAARASVKILYGKELGLGPIQSMLGIDFQPQGGLSLRAHTIASLIKQSKRYDYRIVRHDDDGCEIEFFSVDWEADPAKGPKRILTSLGKASFDKQDAIRAGLNLKATYKQHPRDMYYNRAMAKGARWHCPDVFGAPVYCEDELAPAEPGPRRGRPPKARDEQPPEVPSDYGNDASEVIDTQATVVPPAAETTDTSSADNQQVTEIIEALGAKPESVPESLRPDPIKPAQANEDLLATELPPKVDSGSVDRDLNATSQEKAQAAEIIEASARLQSTKVDRSTGEINVELVMSDIAPPPLVQRILATTSGPINPKDLNDFHAYLADFLGGGDKGRKAATAAWDQVGVTVKKGVTVTREQAVTVSLNVNPNPVN